MESSETIDEMHNKFINIINSLSVLRKTFSNVEINSKILRSLPREWEAKRTAIEEAHDLSKMSKEELLGTLKTHEMVKKQNEDSRKRSIALKVSNDDSSSNESDDEIDDDEMAMVARNFKKFMKFNNKMKKKEEIGGSSRNRREKKDVITCYKCHKPGHIQQYCPLLKKAKGNKNEALMATWSDDDSTDSEDNLCFMAIDDEVCSTTSSIAYNELSSMYNKLCKEMAKMEKKNKTMKEMMLSMNDELEDFKSEFVKLKDSHDKLEEENDFLRYENEKSKEESEKLKKENNSLNDEVANLNEELENKNIAMNDENHNLKELEELKVEKELLKASLEDANKTIAKFVEGEKNLNMILS